MVMPNLPPESGGGKLKSHRFSESVSRESLSRALPAKLGRKLVQVGIQMIDEDDCPYDTLLHSLRERSTPSYFLRYGMSLPTCFFYS